MADVVSGEREERMIEATLSSLTKPQKDLIEKAKAGPIRPYHGQWTTFYRLLRLGLMSYSPPAASRNSLLTVELTKTALEVLSRPAP